MRLSLTLLPQPPPLLSFGIRLMRVLSGLVPLGHFLSEKQPPLDLSSEDLFRLPSRMRGLRIVAICYVPTQR
jgi:hypothetical protein